MASREFKVSALLFLIIGFGYFDFEQVLAKEVLHLFSQVEIFRVIGNRGGMYSVVVKGKAFDNLFLQLCGYRDFGRANIRTMLVQMRECVKQILPELRRFDNSSTPPVEFLTNGNYQLKWFPGGWSGLPLLGRLADTSVTLEAYRRACAAAADQAPLDARDPNDDVPVSAVAVGTRVVERINSTIYEEDGFCYVRAMFSARVDRSMGPWPLAKDLLLRDKIIRAYPAVQVTTGYWHVGARIPGRVGFPIGLLPAGARVGGLTPGPDSEITRLPPAFGVGTVSGETSVRKLGWMPVTAWTHNLCALRVGVKNGWYDSVPVKMGCRSVDSVFAKCASGPFIMGPDGLGLRMVVAGTGEVRMTGDVTVRLSPQDFGFTHFRVFVPPVVGVCIGGLNTQGKLVELELGSDGTCFAVFTAFAMSMVPLIVVGSSGVNIEVTTQDALRTCRDVSSTVDVAKL